LVEINISKLIKFRNGKTASLTAVHVITFSVSYNDDTKEYRN